MFASKSMNDGKTKTVIVHLTESGGGVLEYIKEIVENTPEIDHILIMRKRSFFSNSDLSQLQNLQVIEWNGNLFKGVIAALQIYSRNNADYLHLHSSLAGLARLVPKRIRIIYSPHCYAFERIDISRLFRALIYLSEYLLSVNTTKYMCVSEREKRLTGRFLKKSRVLVLNFPTSKWLAKRPLRYIVSIGRICAQKNPTEFIKIASMVRVRNADVGFVWIGDGDRDLRKLLEDNQIQVMGWLDKKGVLSMVSESSAVLHTANWEGMPVVFSEVMASGVPLIVRKANYLINFAESYICSYSSLLEASEWIENKLEIQDRNIPFIFSKEKFTSVVSELYLR